MIWIVKPISFGKAKWIIFFKDICYRYQVLNIDKQVVEEEIVSHFLLLDPIFDSYQIQDTWNRKNFPENYLNNKIFKNKKSAFVPENVKLRKIHTHLFRIEAPLYNPNWKIILIGDISELGLWQYDQAIALQEVDFGVWEVALTISASYNFEYKYGIYDNESKQVIFIEGGDNRISTPNLSAEMLHFKK